MIDQYLSNMKFAQDLLGFMHCHSYLMFEFEVLWEPELSIFDLEGAIPSLFSEEVGYCVMDIIIENNDIIQGCYEDFVTDGYLFRNDDIDVAYFARRALDIAPMFFTQGYSHGAFFGYCAMVIGVAFYFFNLKPNCVPTQACQVIGLVLFMQQMTGEFYADKGWKGFHDIAVEFNKYFNGMSHQRDQTMETLT